jgi:hypothetical protein
MPRSPSRDVVDRFTGNRGYFHHADGLRRWKNLVTLVALGLTLGWLIVEFAWPARAVSAHSHGELASVHAAFDANCQACHQPHSRGDFLANPASLFDPQARWHDLTCTKCHAGPAHHARAEDAAFHEDCSNCHHDHQGRDQSLVRIADSHCTRCHANLSAAHDKGRPQFAESITGFARDHPEFRPLTPGKAEAERRLKFSHSLHMTPGLVYAANDQHKWTAESLGKQFGPDARDRFLTPNGHANEPVQLQCSSCHQLDADPQSAIVPARAEGAYYLPVNFDVHCKVCHPLRTPTAVSAGMAIPAFNVPHRRQPESLRLSLRGEYAARLASDKHPALAAPLGPGGRLDPPDSPAIAAFGAEIHRLTDAAMKALLLNLAAPGKAGEGRSSSGGFACGKCHYSAEAGKNEIAALPNKSVWFEHAKFNHVAHRGLTCAACHPGTEGSFAPGDNVNEREPALIVGIKTCQACHAKAGTTVPLPDGQMASAAGIRHSCVDCHRYHNGDRPLQGLGSPRRDPVQPLNLNEWFQGKK